MANLTISRPMDAITTASHYKTIKDLVFDIIYQTSGLASYEQVTEAVLEHFPESAWKDSHWAYYRSQITHENGRYKDEFSDEIKANLRGAAKSQKRSRGDVVKQIGDKILEQTRFAIELAAANDARLRFKLRRWVYARLQQEEIREKRPIKQALWDSGIKSCPICGKEFNSLKNVEIHRKDTTEGYSINNCQLLCRRCHQGIK